MIGTRLLASVNVQAALEARLAKETAASILSARERDEMLSQFARTSGDVHARTRVLDGCWMQRQRTYNNLL